MLSALVSSVLDAWPLLVAAVGAAGLWFAGRADGRASVELEAERAIAEAQRRMAEADARGPRDRDAAAERLRGGKF